MLTVSLTWLDMVYGHGWGKLGRSKRGLGEAVIARIKTCEFHFKDHRNKNA